MPHCYRPGGIRLAFREIIHNVGTLASVSTKLLAGVRGRSASAGRVFAPAWLFSSCQRPLHQEGALSAPCSCDVLLLAIAPSGRENAAGSALKPFRGHFVVRGHRFIMLPTMMVPCWWRQMHALSALVQRPSRAVVARGLRHIVITYEDSSVFGTQQEAKKNYLVTMTSTASSSIPCPVRLLLCQSDPERLSARSGRSVTVLSRGPHFC